MVQKTEQWLQNFTKQAINASLKVDDVVGNKTAITVNEFVELAGSKVTNSDIVEESTEFHHRLIDQKPIQQVFRRDWMNKAKQFAHDYI